MILSFSAGMALCGLFWLPFASSAAEWTPADFDWDSLRVNDTAPSGLWMYKHEAPGTTDLSVLSANHPTTIDAAGSQQIGVLAALGFAWRVGTVAVFASSLKNTINSCKQTANEGAGVGPCLEGVMGTVFAFGGAASANKKALHKAGSLILPHRFLPDGTVDLVRVTDLV